MNFTFFSLVMAVIWVSIFAKATSILRKQMFFFRYFSLSPLILILSVCIIRLLFSVELPYTKTINSKKFFPFLQHFFCEPFISLFNINISLANILIIIWITVAFKRIFENISKHYHLNRLLNFFSTTNDKRLYKILAKVDTERDFSKVKILVNESVRSPSIIGFFSPIIILPNIPFTDDELFGIFTHEWMHYRYYHIFIKCIVGFIQAFFWWNPIFKELYDEVNHSLEMHSDKMTCKLLNSHQQNSYLNAITKVTRHLNQENFFSTLSCSLVEKGDCEKLEQRFRMILEKKYQNKGNKNIFIMPLIIMLFALSYICVLQPYSEPDLNQYGSMQEILVGSYLVKKNEGYVLLDSENNFIANIAFLDDGLKDLKIYKTRKDIP